MWKGDLGMPEVKEAIEAAIKAEDSSANDIYLSKVVSDFVESDVYYASWKSTKLPENESFFYVLVTKDGNLRTYDDGVLAIEKLKDILDSRRSFWQRLREFSLVEVMGAVIALCVTSLFIYLSIEGINNPDALSKEFTGIFGIIVGYYFGKNMPSK
jgi:hypothetical protein